MKTADRVFGWLLVLAGVLHLIGSAVSVRSRPELLVWAQAGGLAVLLVAALNLMRVNRPADRTLAWLSLWGTVGWLAVVVGVAVTIHNAFDPRVVFNAIVGVALLVFSARTLSRA